MKELQKCWYLCVLNGFNRGDGVVLTDTKLILEPSNIANSIVDDQKELINRGEDEGIKSNVEFIEHAIV